MCHERILYEAVEWWEEVKLDSIHAWCHTYYPINLGCSCVDCMVDICGDDRYLSGPDFYDSYCNIPNIVFSELSDE